MRELTVRIRFTSPCLGNVKRYIREERKGNSSWPVFYMPRTPGDNRIRFEANWWRSSLRFAANVMCRHQRLVNNISFDVTVDGRTDTNVTNFFKRYFKGDSENGSRFVRHEAFMPGDVIGINCVVPSEITDQDLWTLLDYVGRFRGISPYDPKNYGRFEVESIRQKTVTNDNQDIQGRERYSGRSSNGQRQAGPNPSADVHPAAASGNEAGTSASQQEC